MDSRFNITVTSYRKFKHDTDGISVKAVLDGLVRTGILSDDSTEEIKSITFKSEKANDEKTIIEIEDDCMSYSRWSTPIENGLSLREYFDCYKTKGGQGLLAEYKKRGTIFSDWYIYWCTSSGDTRYEQYLAVWNKHSNNHPTLSYKELKDAMLDDDFSILGCDLTQVEYLKDCINEWLTDVEQEYPADGH